MELKIFDETLRDGEQMPGVVFKFDEKLKLAEKINDFGVDAISLMPLVSEEEKQLTAILKDRGIKINAVCPTRIKEIDETIELEPEHIGLFNKPEFFLKEENLQILDYVKERGIKIKVACEGIPKISMNKQLQIIKNIKSNVDYLVYADTTGILTPWETIQIVKKISKHVKIEFHAHNDLGMATANTLAAIKAGAAAFSGTFCGIGERAGNAAIEEVIMALKITQGKELNVKYEMLKEICDEVRKAANILLPPHKPIVGDNAFAHESGIHVDGILKNPLLYEPFNPSIIGHSRTIMFGKHSGRANLRYLLEKYSLSYTEEELIPLIKKVKQEAINKKRSLMEEEVLALYALQKFNRVP